MLQCTPIRKRMPVFGVFYQVRLNPFSIHKVQRRMISMVNFFRIFEIMFCFVVDICDLVHDVETIFYLSYVLTASGNYF